MKTFKLIGVFGALALAAVSSAASAGDSLRVHVPFSFVVAGQQFAAGDYVVQQSQNGVVLVQGGGKGAMVLSTPSAPPNPNGSSSLRFTTAGQQLHLVAVEQRGLDSRAIPVRTVEQRSLTLTSR